MDMEIKRLFTYTYEENMPTYGNRLRFKLDWHKSFNKGDLVNESIVTLPSHCGTHCDLPSHFYNVSNSNNYYSPQIISNVLVLSVENVTNRIVKGEDLNLDCFTNLAKDIEGIMIYTGECHKRNFEDYSFNNTGFHASVAKILRENFPILKYVMIDTISLSPIGIPGIGFDSHREFLSPENPLIVIEDVNMREVTAGEIINKLAFVPLPIANAEALPINLFELNE